MRLNKGKNRRCVDFFECSKFFKGVWCKFVIFCNRGRRKLGKKVTPKTSALFPQTMSCHRILNRQKNLTTKSTASFWTSERSCTPTDRTTFRQSLNLHRRLRAEGDGKEISSYSLFILQAKYSGTFTTSSCSLYASSEKRIESFVLFFFLFYTA